MKKCSKIVSVCLILAILTSSLLKAVWAEEMIAEPQSKAGYYNNGEWNEID